MKILIAALIIGISPPQNPVVTMPTGTVACMEGVKVVIVQYLPHGLDIGDSPRYEVAILGTCMTAYPLVESVSKLDETCIQLNDDTGCFQDEK